MGCSRRRGLGLDGGERGNHWSQDRRARRHEHGLLRLAIDHCRLRDPIVSRDLRWGSSQEPWRSSTIGRRPRSVGNCADLSPPSVLADAACALAQQIQRAQMRLLRIGTSFVSLLRRPLVASVRRSSIGLWSGSSSSTAIPVARFPPRLTKDNGGLRSGSFLSMGASFPELAKREWSPSVPSGEKNGSACRSVRYSGWQKDLGIAGI